MRTAQLLTLTLLVCVLPACKTSDPNVKQAFGTYEKLIDSTPLKVAEAAEAVLNDLKLLEIETKKTGLDGRITARTAQKEPIVINVMRVGENVTRIKVRVGGMGDRGMSLSILDKIDKKLGK